MTDACATKRFVVMVHEICETWYEVNAKNKEEAAAKAMASSAGHEGRAAAARKVKSLNYSKVDRVVAGFRPPHNLRVSHAVRLALAGAK